MKRLNWGLGAWGSVILWASPTVAFALPIIHTIEGGTVLVRRQDSGVYIYGRTGLPLQPRDGLLPSRGARVLVDCPNGERQRVTPGRLSGVRVICPDLATSFDGRDEEDLLQLLAGRFPYMPRALRSAPTFSWPQVTPTAPYEVQLVRIDVVDQPGADEFSPPTPVLQETVLQEAVVQGNYWRYGGPALEAEGQYGLRVRGQGEGAEVLYQVGFWGVSPGAEATLAETRAELATQAIPPAEAAMVQAHALFDLALHWEVIAVLQPWAEEGALSPGGHQLLAESYLRTGRYGRAETRYGAAITLAQEVEDQRMVAAAWVGLAKVAAADQNAALTVQRLTVARQLYMGLVVDEGWVEIIDDWLTAGELHQE